MVLDESVDVFPTPLVGGLSPTAGSSKTLSTRSGFIVTRITYEAKSKNAPYIALIIMEFDWLIFALLPAAVRRIKPADRKTRKTDIPRSLNPQL